MRKPVVSGEIPVDGVISVLQEIETRRTSGFLRFESGPAQGEVVLVAGQVALDQADLPDGRDPVETFLALRSGRYEVHQKLPALTGTTNDGLSIRGSIGQHPAADLLKFCERIGLTGLLTLKKNERVATAAYDRGELIAIRVDGQDEPDLNDVFAWETGEFHVQTHLERPNIDDASSVDLAWTPSEPSSKRPASDTGRQRLLKVVEVALTSVLEQAEKRRPSRAAPVKTPDLPPRRPSSRPPPPLASEPRADATVRIVYLEPRDVAAPEGIRHVQKDVTAEHILPKAQPHRLPSDKGSAIAAPAPEAATTITKPTASARSRTWLWIAIVVALGLATYAALQTQLLN